MKINTQIKKLDHYDVHERSHFERVGSVVLAAAAVFSIAAENHAVNTHLAKADAAVKSAYAAVHHKPAEKTELVRMPIKFDEGLRAQVATGV